MTGDFAKFFQMVQKAARECGMEAHLVCGVASDGGGKIKISSNARHTFEGKDQKFMGRCIDAMQDSVDQALSQLGDETPEPELRN